MAYKDLRVDPPRRFADRQLSGPYTLWLHTHSFEERDGGTLCRDDVRYWPRGGALMNWLFVRRDVARIFQYQRERLSELFPGIVNAAEVSAAAK